jgi:hypothetical protein
MMAEDPESKKAKNTGKAVGGGCVIAFGSIFGIIGLLVIGYYSFRLIRINTVFKQATCTLVSKNLKVSSDSDGTTYKPEFTYNFTVDGRQYTGTVYEPVNHSSSQNRAQNELNKYQVGRTYTCWYDPLNPTDCVLTKNTGWSILFPVIFGGMFLLFGFCMVFFSLYKSKKSKESAAAGRSKTAAKASSALPLPDVSSTKGKRLALRLKPQVSRLGMVFGIAIACVFWNGIVSVFLYQLLGPVRQSGFTWMTIFIALFLVPFVLIGIFIFGAFLYQLLLLTTHEPVVEIDHEPLIAGSTMTLELHQPGTLNYKSLTVRLVCDERASYTRGTDTISEKHVVFEREMPKVSDGPNWRRFSATLPEDAMHSFKAPHNEIVWRIEVKAERMKWLGFTQEFVVRVLPGAAGVKQHQAGAA